MSLSEDARSKRALRTNYNVPRWTDVSKRVNEFATEANGVISDYLFSTFSDSMIGQFATWSSRKNGAADEGFYITICLYIIHASDSGLLDNEYFQSCIPARERQLPSFLKDFILSKLGSAMMLESPRVTARPRFNIEKANNERLKNIAQRFISEVDDCAHMVIYRPNDADPNSLVKTFLAISPPERVSPPKLSFQFSHILKPERGSSSNRFSSGKIIPLEEAIYFVGGHKPWMIPKKATDAPFSGLKILVFNWSDMEKLHPIIPGLAISTNAKGKPISSRIAGRMTPLAHHDDISLKSVKLEKLNDDLTDDYFRELEAIARSDLYKANRTFFSLHSSDPEDVDNHIVEACSDILKFTNNGPADGLSWDVPPGYKSSRGKAKKELSRDLIGLALTNNNFNYKNEDGEKFNLWTDTRFGVLDIK